MVETPFINEFHTKTPFERGWGYSTPLDWAKSILLKSYCDSEVFRQTLPKYCDENKIINGIGIAKLLANEPNITKNIKKIATPWELRMLGLRTY